MRGLAWMACLGVVASWAGPQAQAAPEPSAAPGAQAPGETPTFRVGTRVATIDAVVVDERGQHVTDLTPDDFEVVERGKRQPVRQAIYLRVVGPNGVAIPPPIATPPPAAPGTAAAEAPRARPLAGGSGLASADRTGRVIALVVDDLGLSFESTAYVRRMLTRYVDTQVGPGDLVAIIRTAGGVGALQQFTTDRRLLHAAIDRVRWSLQSRSGVAAFEAVLPGKEAGKLDEVDALRQEVTSAGTLGALQYVLRGIAPMPGRKSVVFVSEGFDLGIRDAKVSRTWSAFTRVMDDANRAGVVVYTMDARGLQTGGLSAEDDPQTPRIAMPFQSVDPTTVARDAQQSRLRQLFDSQDSLLYLAEQTGGFAVLNTNDLSGGLSRVLDDTRGYYLIGFDTALPNSDPWDPSDVRIHLKRPGLMLRARRGLFGPADKRAPRETGSADPLVAAALSPFAAGAIDVRLTTLFAHDKKTGSYVRTLFFIDPAGLTFVDGPDGRRDADLTLLMLAVGDNGQAVGQARIEVPLRLDADAYRQLRQRGLLYSARVAIQAPGGYQVRAAVQDDRSRAIGTGAQFVEVPAVGKNRVALSSVVMMDVQALRSQVGGGDAAAAPADTAVLAVDGISDGVLGEPAIKIFKPGTEVVYTCEIYDGRGKRQEGFSTSATLLRDGKPFYTTPAAPIGGAPQDAKPVGSVPVAGTLTLGRGLPRGTYTLRISVGPRTGGGRDRHASQWVDFEVR